MNCNSPRWVWPQNKPLHVPCGKCLPCLVNRRSDWSFRLMQEWKRSESSAFITLTYSAKFVPDTGVSKRHFQLFMKRLRKKSGLKLRYYAVGEYGSKRKRAHYHAIIFNFRGDDKFLQSCWMARGSKEPFGIVHIGKVSEASIRYTTKYIIQRAEIVPKGLHPQFCLMSRQYGLGAHYLSDAMVTWHRANRANYTLIHGEKGRLPRFYKDKIWYRSKCDKAQGGFIIHKDRESVSQESAYQARTVARKNLALFFSIYGRDAEARIAEHRHAVISRIKEKVAFTQTL